MSFAIFPRKAKKIDPFENFLFAVDLMEGKSARVPVQPIGTRL